jgi:uncharacterized protein
MKKISFYILSAMLLPMAVFAQAEGGKSRIATIARYTTQGVELRWMPDNKTILRLGFSNSYTIQRSENGQDRFSDIATVRALSREGWSSLIAAEKDAATRSDLETAMEFLFAGTASGQQLNLEAGIAELNEQKRKEDMIYALFVITAVRNGKVAEGLGLNYIDNTAKEGMTYQYRVKLNAVSPVYAIENGTVVIKAVIDPNKYRNEVFVYPGDKQLSFAWSANPELNGYFIERAAEGQTVFKPLNSIAIYDSRGDGFEGPVNGSFEDDSLLNYKWYSYRFYGTTSFGEKVLFAEVKGMPRDLTPPVAPVLKQPKHVKPREVQVGWDMTVAAPDLKGFIVARSDRDTGTFQVLHKTLLPAKSRSFTDTGFSTDGINYYVVYALDTAGNISASYPGYVALVDSTPPAVPEVLSALIDSLGVVTIRVQPGKEKDLKGYRIFKANSDEHELSAIQEAFKKDKADTAALRSVFTDTVTLGSLTPNIYYRIKALDYNYNQSAFSKMIIVRRPDTVPPITPVFTNVLTGEKKVTLHFAPSESIDVKEQIIYRKTDPNSEWAVLSMMSGKQAQFIDTTVTPGITYYYSLRARDESDLYSGFAYAVYGKPYKSPLPPVTNLTGKLQDKKIVLQWEYPATAKEVFFIVYKKNKKGALEQVARVTAKTFTDVGAGKENVYAIKVLTADGEQSKLSAMITQRIP